MSNEQIREDSLPAPDDYPLPRPTDEGYPPRRRFNYNDMRKDKDHLRTLAIFYYIVAVLLGRLGLFRGIYVVMGIAMASGSMGRPPKGPPPELGFALIAGGSLAILFFEAFAVCVFVAGRSLVAQKRYIFCFVIAVLLCLQGIPVMLLGIFSIVVLARESVKELFTRADLAFGADGDYD